MSKHFDLSGRVAVITGGARGIGLAAAQRMADAGADIAVVDRDADATAAAVRDIEARGRRALGCPIELTDEQAVAAMTDEVVEKLGGYHILVCAAAIVGRNAFAWETTAEEWRNVMEINTTALWLCNREALRPMRAQDYGRIVNIASIAGKEGNPKLGPYSASKAAVIGMTKSLGKELSDTNVRVNCITPAVIETEILKQCTQAHIDYMLSKIPMGRVGQAAEVAAMIAWLSSDEVSFSTGAVFDISGGRATY